MKTLPLTRKHGGFHFRQIARQDNAAIYEQTKPGQQAVHYEVVRIRRQARREFARGEKRVVVEEMELYPSSERWGLDGWTFNDADAAWTKLRQIAA